jgi:hypothetical protein
MNQLNEKTTIIEHSPLMISTVITCRTILDENLSYELQISYLRDYLFSKEVNEALENVKIVLNGKD